MTIHKSIYTTAILFLIVLCGFTMTGGPNDELLKIAKEYKTYRQYVYTNIVVTDSARYKWTIVLCALPPKGSDLGFRYEHDSLLLSTAKVNLSKHGNKLYKLFIKDYDNYIRDPEYGQPTGQVIVKETWNVAETEYDSINKAKEQFKNWNDGKWYAPTSVSELFIMYKEEQKPTNDKGWVYAIVNLEDKAKQPTVLYSGNLSNCISCHKGTKYDRIFGVNQIPKTK